ncbi:MAG TPA: hypothetical protein VI455_14270 [Terriglobia bacterium]
MRVPNEPGEPKGSFYEFLQLQNDFYGRLAEETMKYLRRLQAAGAPATPGTVLLPDGSVELRGSGTPGASVEFRLEVENRQRVHCMVTPMLSPLVDASGTTWFPAARLQPPSKLLAPEEVGELVIAIPLPADVPAGTYRGALLLQGFREGAIAVAVTVARGVSAKPGTAAPAGRRTVPPVKPARATIKRKKRRREPARRK